MRQTNLVEAHYKYRDERTYPRVWAGNTKLNTPISNRKNRAATVRQSHLAGRQEAITTHRDCRCVVTTGERIKSSVTHQQVGQAHKAGKKGYLLVRSPVGAKYKPLLEAESLCMGDVSKAQHEGK